ncbi:3-hydroxyacyl-CoA dehydrogenase family protein [Brevibacterium sp. 91QC2O2]|jgi:3-hydroxybutyryl-CoA dehydrogenase|uniref:3-hydroxyacyl-CoA dehydrogenase family protein n=1 Tax=Brevibacterium TaxID=1696 RepID=UPI00211CDDE4|nr:MULTISPECIES: 3-hydroxyacyl-CoA dehydrogenase family protein [unclassified Brevibacterium]MCQ9368840.1 3-hydroxyacyl-CoA dehydrogenase family protein [Brevibacterium sp. 91QC2O2]MCQ9386588.1 3-hydroxyacyl-CoA dehydrogenase family protein [Brevibacterium sp. 68QC2CO]
MSVAKIDEALHAGTSLMCAVVGTGYMGGGIAQILALHGHTVQLADVDAARTIAARERLIAQGAQYAAEGLFPAEAEQLLQANLIAAASREEAVAQAAYIAEAVPEDPEIKRATLELISQHAPADAVIGSNTSSIPIRELSEFVTGPQRFLGVHWMNPAPFVPGVEIIPGPQTSAEVVRCACELITSLGKTATRVTDAAGFVSNRLQFALYAEASRMVDEELATPQEIDAVARSCFGFRLPFFGPFAIGDMAGLDVYAGSYETLEAECGERFAMPAPVRAAMESGDLGLKTGHGLLDLDESQTAELLAYRERAYAKLSQLCAELGPAPGFK